HVNNNEGLCAVLTRRKATPMPDLGLERGRGWPASLARVPLPLIALRVSAPLMLADLRRRHNTESRSWPVCGVRVYDMPVWLTSPPLATLSAVCAPTDQCVSGY